MRQTILLIFLLKCISCQLQCEKKIVDVSSKVTTCRNHSLYHHFICPTIQSAVEFMTKEDEIGLNDACIRLQSNQILKNILMLVNVVNLTITKNESQNIDIKCKFGAGLKIIKSSNILIQGINFNQCGAIHLLTEPSNFEISSALLIYDVTNLSLVDSSFLSSRGYSIFLKYISGNFLFKNLHVYNGSLVPHMDSYGIILDYYGGGVHLEFNFVTINQNRRRVVFESCLFSSNIAHTNSLKQKTNVYGLPFKKGGGLTVLMRKNTTSDTLLIHSCRFEKNKGVRGGGLYVTVGKKMEHVNITLDQVEFIKNRAEYSGGGLIISLQQTHFPNHFINLKGCVFKQNKVRDGEGGGVTFRSLIHKMRNIVEGHFKNCTFSKNFAHIGSSVHIQNVYVSFTDIVLHGIKGTNNSHELTSNDLAGGLYAFQCHLQINGDNNRVQGHEFTGFILDTSLLSLNGKIIFSDNKGYNGGAVSLLGHSNVVFGQRSVLNLTNNYAYKNGGGIHFAVPNPIFITETIGFDMYPCFLTFQGGIKNFKGRIEFHNNTCKNSGSAIFSSTLHNCKVEVEFISKNHNFPLPKDQTINTYAVGINISRADWNVWPGKVFQPKILLYDELYQKVNEAIDVKISSQNGSVQIESKNERFLVRNERIKLKLLVSKKLHERYDLRFNLSVSLARDGTIKTRCNELKLKPCQLGFTFTEKQCMCNIQKNEVRGIAACYGDKPYILLGRWAMPNQSALATDSETTQACPKNYCRKKCNDSITKLSCPYEPEKFNQCAVNRSQTSILCSQCKENLSVALGSGKCMDCTRVGKLNILWFLPAMITAMILIVWIIIRLDVDIYKHFLNGFLYYYQLLPLLIQPNFQYWNGLDHFVSIMNLNGVGDGFSLCLWNGLNDLQKMAFNYTIPFLLILVLIGFSLSNKYWRKDRSREEHCIHAFIVISVWAYTDLTRITFLLLKPDNINCTLRVHIYAHVEYLSSEHLGFFILASIVFTIVVAFPFMLLFSSWLRNFNSCFYIFNNPFARWVYVFDSFKDSFKDDRQYFVSYYFFCRLIFLGITTFMEKDVMESMLLAILCLIVCLIFQLALPYKTNTYFWTNIYDVIALADLTAVAILSFATRVVRKDEDKKLFMNIINVLMLLPLILFLMRITYLLFNLSKKRIQGKELCFDI